MYLIRLLLPGEAPRYAAHLRRLTPEDRRVRFMGSVSDATILAYCRSLNWRRTLVLGAFEDGEIRAAVELSRPGAGPAELAVSVERDWQGRGLGTVLMRRMLVLARNRNIPRVRLIYLSENYRMRRIAARLIGPSHVMQGEAVSEGRLSPPTPLTLAQEVLDAGLMPLHLFLEAFRPGSRGGTGRRAVPAT